jgi:hypothetical protein
MRHVHAGGQAVVGMVETPGGRDCAKSQDQPHGGADAKGSHCQAPAMPNGRCRMHGGKSSGAPKGNCNARKHGHNWAEAPCGSSLGSCFPKLARRKSACEREIARRCLLCAYWCLAGALPCSPKSLKPLVPPDWIEQSTPSLPMTCSTTELRRLRKGVIFKGATLP